MSVEQWERAGPGPVLGRRGGVQDHLPEQPEVLLLQLLQTTSKVSLTNIIYLTGESFHINRERTTSLCTYMYVK